MSMQIPKFKIGTAISIDRQLVLDFFEEYIDHKIENEDSYLCLDGSLLILNPSGISDKVFVKFHCNLQIDNKERSLSFQGKNWFLKFCKENDSQIENLSTLALIPASEGALMSDLFSSEAFRIAKHQSQHPNDEVSE